MIIWDGQMPDRYPTVGLSHEELMARMQRLAAAVPHDVELGFHLCYGDLDGKHFVEPRDAGKMVELANVAGRHRHASDLLRAYAGADRAHGRRFFQPFRNLRLSPGTDLYLGVVHAADGVEGAEKRLAAAGKHVRVSGIATECGMARAKTPDVVIRLLEIHAKASREPAAHR
jgi:hypothetical protein